MRSPQLISTAGEGSLPGKKNWARDSAQTHHPQGGPPMATYTAVHGKHIAGHRTILAKTHGKLAFTLEIKDV
jgi:hypothetical protein